MAPPPGPSAFLVELIELDVYEDVAARALAKIETGVWGGVGFAGVPEPTPDYIDARGWLVRGGGPGKAGGARYNRRGLLYSDPPPIAPIANLPRANRDHFNRRLAEESES